MKSKEIVNIPEGVNIYPYQINLCLDSLCPSFPRYVAYLPDECFFNSLPNGFLYKGFNRAVYIAALKHQRSTDDIETAINNALKAKEMAEYVINANNKYSQVPEGIDE